MEHDRKLSGNGDLGLLEADAFRQPEAPGFQCTPMQRAGEQHAGCIEEAGPEHSIATLGDPSRPIDLSRGMGRDVSPT